MNDKPSNLERKPDSTATFTLTIPKEKVKKGYQKALSIATQQAQLKGFRKGKAPASLVEKELGKQKLYTQALQHLLPEAYAEAAKSLSLKPISGPRIEPEKLEEDHDWQLKVTVAEKPDIKLGDYKKIVSGAKSADKIWVPGKDQDPSLKGEKKQSTEELISKVLDTLLQNIQFTLPEFLIDEEVNRLLSQLLDQIQKLGMNLDQYLASLNKTSEQLRKEYRDQAERSLRLELILNEISDDLKITVEKKEIDDLIQAVGDEKLKKKLNTPSERIAVRASLRKRKVIDALLKL